MPNDIRGQINDLAADLLSAQEKETGEAEEEIAGEEPGESEENDEESLEEESTEELDDENEDARQEQIIHYFNDLPEHIGISPEDFYKLKLKLANGDELTLSEMKDRLQSEQTRLVKLEADEASLREQQEAMQAQIASGMAGQAQQSREMAEAQGQMYALKSAWSGLQRAQEDAERSGDTAELTRVNNDMLKLQNMYANTQIQFQQAHQKFVADQQQAMMKFRQDQEVQLKKLIPNWGDKQRQEIGKYLIDNFSISNQELDNMFDARAWLLAEKARAWDLHMEKVSKAKEGLAVKQLKAVPGKQGVKRKSSKVRAAKKLDDTITAARSRKRRSDKMVAVNALAKAMTDGDI